MDKQLNPEVFPFYDEQSNTFSYVVKDPSSSACAIIDSVLDLDYPSGSTCNKGADEIIKYVQTHKLDVQWLIETHVHADHLSGAPYLQEKLGGKLAISKHITTIQEMFGKLFNEGTEFERDGSQFDVLFEDNEHYQIGNLDAQAIYTPGYTPACMTHLVGDAAFVGDTLFMPDGGTARADFSGGDAHALYESIQLILSWPDETRIFMCHDYQPDGRAVEYLTNVKEQKLNNIHINQNITEQEFVDMREERDATLGMPRLIFPSLQVNMRAGHFPPAESNDMRYLKVPINQFK